MSTESRPWHHRPCHVFEPDTMYIITAGTMYKQYFFRGDERLVLLEETLFDVFHAHEWRLEAWAIFSNHYHVIAGSPEGAKSLGLMLKGLHSLTARAVNRMDAAPGRKVCFQYWDTCLTYEDSYYARLNYVYHNAVHHGMAALPEHYRFCSANWFNQNADPGYRRKVMSYRFDNVNVVDDF